MRIDEELRVALTREADARTAPPPDVIGMITGGRVRRRRHTALRLSATAAVVVLAGSAAYGVTLADPFAPRTGDPGPARTSLPPDAGPRELEPGRLHRMLVGSRETGTVIEADVTVDGPGWVEADFARLEDRTGGSWVGFGVYEPHAVASGSGCVDDPRTVQAGATPRALTAQLARLPRSEVLQQPTRIDVFGHDGMHLRMRIDTDCRSFYRVADSARGERGITYPGLDGVPVDVVIDFWVMDLDGTPIVVDQWRNIDAPAGLVAEATRARESITFVERD